MTDSRTRRMVVTVRRAADVTFVVQGRIEREGEFTTRACLSSIRRFYSGARIVLSTWEGEDVENLGADVVIRSPDPGAPRLAVVGTMQNRPNSLNRMIVSTAAGLATVTTPYAVRMRSDFVVTSPALLDLHDRQAALFPARDRQWSVFGERILCPNIYCVDTFKQGIAYHISDLLHVGRTEDVRRLWDVSLMTADELSYCIDNDLLGHHYRHAARFMPEQWVWMQCIQRAGVPCRMPAYYYHCDGDIERDSARLLLNNFIVVPYGACGVASKFDRDTTFEKRCWTAVDFRRAYERTVVGRVTTRLGPVARLRRLGWSRLRKWLFSGRVRRDDAWIQFCGVRLDFGRCPVQRSLRDDRGASRRRFSHLRHWWVSEQPWLHLGIGVPGIGGRARIGSDAVGGEPATGAQATRRE